MLEVMKLERLEGMFQKHKKSGENFRFGLSPSYFVNMKSSI